MKRGGKEAALLFPRKLIGWPRGLRRSRATCAQPSECADALYASLMRRRVAVRHHFASAAWAMHQVDPVCFCCCCELPSEVLRSYAIANFHLHCYQVDPADLLPNRSLKGRTLVGKSESTANHNIISLTV